MGRKRSLAARLRWPAALLFVLLIAAVAGWWRLIHWTPSREAFPMQGVLVEAGDGAVDFRALRAIGADFAYIEASEGEKSRDPDFIRYFAAARAAGLQVGAVHDYDPCIPAERQSANFVTVVARDPELLPPAIALERTAENCPTRVSEAAVESELMTFLNQVEGHVGKPALLKVSPAFEQAYHLAPRLERNLWLTRTYFQPDYGGRPWTLWTANTMLHTEAGSEPVRWVVVQL
ncbi:lysozyme [Croceicoccus estronivorus]|uniref:glycoside hydrolase family 25 protein n=1 Tax=Croceicoccus estronivorus TaxID=1172626 RepID=UPI00082C55F3|nr:glycoside hydrolase family 25 protein [Croceicoccus estronivorus]OCC25470.1 lysozyme [Croceicoccus estronivorus]